MENNEIMAFENEEIMGIDAVKHEDSGINAVAAMAIGAGLTFLIGIGVKFTKKAIERWKNSKNQTNDDPAPAEEVEDVSEN